MTRPRCEAWQDFGLVFAARGNALACPRQFDGVEHHIWRGVGLDDGDGEWGGAVENGGFAGGISGRSGAGVAAALQARSRISVRLGIK